MPHNQNLFPQCYARACEGAFHISILKKRTKYNSRQIVSLDRNNFVTDLTNF
jgi:hypothetical protein